MEAKFVERKEIGGNKTIRLYKTDYERWEFLKDKYNVPDAVRSAISRLFDEMMEQEAERACTEEQAAG